MDDLIREEISAQAQAMREELTQIRRALHADAETGFDLQRTKEFVKEKLKSYGIAPKDCGKAGVTATIGGKKAGKVFLLRADMDALPIEEQSGAPYACKNGNMHACGHDMHTAMLLGAAKILKAHEDKLKGTVKLMFQPAEEIFAGARDMMKDGLLNNPSPDAAMMIHVMAGVPIPAGTALVSAPGVSAPSADYFTVEVKGKGCHGSSPNAGADPVTAAAHILIALQEIQARELAMGERAVLTVGVFSAGNAANVIPDRATISGTLRAFDEKTREFIKKRLTEIAEGIAAAFRTEANVTFGNGCPSLLNDKEVSDSLLKYSKELLGKKALSVAELGGGNAGGSMAGSEDFAHISREVPSVMIALAAGETQKGYPYPQHHPKVNFDESVLPCGSALYAYAAARWLEEH